MLQPRVIGVLLLAQQRLEAFYVADGVAQDLHLGQALVGVGGGAALERLEGLVDLAEAPPFAHGGRLAPIGVGGLPLAGLARPQQAPAGLVVPAGRSDVLVLGAVGVAVFVGLQKAAHVDEPRVQVLEEVHVRRVKAGVVIEVVGCRRRREGAEGAVGDLHGA